MAIQAYIQAFRFGYLNILCGLIMMIYIIIFC